MRLLNQLISLFYDLPVRAPRTVVLLATLLAAAGAYIYFFRLPLVTDRKQLINQELATNRIYRAYQREFGDNDLLILVIAAQDTAKHAHTQAVPNARQRSLMKQVARRWAELARTRPDLFPEVIDRLDWTKTPGVAGLYLEQKQLTELVHLFDAVWPDLRNWASRPSLDGSLQLLSEMFDLLPGQDGHVSEMFAQDAVAAAGEAVRFLRAEITAADGQDGTDGAAMFRTLTNGLLDRDGFLFTEDGRLLTVFARITGDPGSQNRFARGIQTARAFLAEALPASASHAGIQAGFAGMPALEFDEMQTTRRDFTRAALLALLGVTGLFVIAFGHLLRPALAAICLCYAIAMTFGLTWLVIGHLNLLAMVFTVILVALGIDFAVHFLTHYEAGLRNGLSPAQALRTTHGNIGGALWMGGLTTAVAFLSASLTEFVGLAELGFIAGTGLILSLLCMILVYPAMLLLLDSRFPPVRKRLNRRPFADVLAARLALPGRPGRHTVRLVLAISFVTVAAGYLFGQYTFDTNLLRLQAVDGEANRWQQVLLSSSDRSLFALSLFRDRAALARAERSFLQMPHIIRSVESAFPVREKEKRDQLLALCDSVSQVRVGLPGTPDPTRLRRQVWLLRQRIRKLRRRNEEAKTHLKGLEQELTALYAALKSTDIEALQSRLVRLQSTVVSAAKQGLQALQRFSCPPDSVTLASIPAPLRQRYVGKQGTLAMAIYPQKNIWEQENLREFVEAVRQTDPHAIGEAVSLYENGQSLLRSFLQASVFSFIAIAVMLLIWSRSLRATLLAQVPLLASFGLLLGLMKLLPGELKWNFTNFFAVPVLIGIGVDSGIHLVRAWQSDDSETFRGAVKGVMLSSATSIIGFGILATSSHQGVRSLGLILFLGLSLGLVVSLSLLPLALNKFSPRRFPDV